MKKNIMYKCLTALFIALLFKSLFFRLPDLFEPDLVLITIAAFIMLEGNLKINQWLDKRITWLENPKRRLLLQSVGFTFFTSIMLYPLMLILHQLRFGYFSWINQRMRELFFPALLFAFTLISIYICIDFFTSWRKSLLEVEKYKTQSAEAQLQNLKNQINPHFLFNNLSVLASLVYKNQQKAVDFINELSKVYRYVLDNKNAELVTLQEELDFIHHYIYLLKIRFDNAVSFLIDIDEKNRQALLPPMCLQMLVENSIQHNEASQAKTLHLSIYTKNDTLVVENNIQPRMEKTESSKTGLRNIISRYGFFTNRKVEISNKGEVFKVTLPLIQMR